MQPPKRKTLIIPVLGIIGLIFCFSFPFLWTAFVNTEAPSASAEFALVQFIGERAEVFMKESATGIGGLYPLRAEARGIIRNITGDWIILETQEEYVLCAKVDIFKVVVEK